MVHFTINGKPHSPDEDSPMIPTTPWPSAGITFGAHGVVGAECPRRLFANFSREVIRLRSDDSGILRDIDLLEWIEGGTFEE